MPELRTDWLDVYVFRRPAPGRVEVLLLRRAATEFMGGTWHAVHGKVKAGESAVNAARRELNEETGLSPLRFWQLEFVNSFFVARWDAILLCPCFAAEVDAQAAVAWNHEHNAAEWLPVAEALARFTWPGQRRAMREVMTEIVHGGPAEPLLRCD